MYSRLADMGSPKAKSVLNLLEKHFDDVREQMNLDAVPNPDPDRQWAQYAGAQFGDDRFRTANSFYGNYIGIKPKDYSTHRLLYDEDYGKEMPQMDDSVPPSPDTLSQHSILNVGHGMKDLASALDFYQGSGFREMNKLFREQNPRLIYGSPQEHENRTQLIMNSMKPSKNDTVMYRGLRDEQAEKLWNQDSAGDLQQFGNKGLMSMSIDPNTAQSGFGHNSGNPYSFYQIMIPAGTPMAPVPTMGALSSEGEYVLGPNARFRKMDMGMKPEEMGSIPLLLTQHGAERKPRYIPDQPGVGWLAGLAPLSYGLHLPDDESNSQ